MTDDQPQSGLLGAAPTPTDEGRERSIEAAMARYDELLVDGRLTSEADQGSVGAPPSTDQPEVPAPVDELARRRRRRALSMNPQRLLAAAALLMVLGVGGLLAVQSMGSNGESTASADQAEALPEADATAQGAAADAEVPDAGAPDAGAPDAGSAERSFDEGTSTKVADAEELADEPGTVASPPAASADPEAPSGGLEESGSPGAQEADPDPAGGRPEWLCRLLEVLGLELCTPR